MVEIDLKRIEPRTVFVIENTGELAALRTLLTDEEYSFFGNNEVIWNGLKTALADGRYPHGLGICIRGGENEKSLGYSSSLWYISETAQARPYKVVCFNEVKFLTNEEEKTMSKYLDLNNLTTTNTIIYCETEDEINKLFEIVQRYGKRAYYHYHESAPCGFRLSRDGNIVNGASGSFYDSAEGIRNYPGPRYNFSELKFDEGSSVGLKLDPEKVRALYGQDVHVVVTNPEERSVFLNGLTEMGLRWAAGQSPWGYEPSETEYGFLSNGCIVHSTEGEAVSVSSLLVDGAEIPSVTEPDPEIWNGRKYDVAKYFGKYACIQCKTPEEARLLKEYAEHYLGCTVTCDAYSGDLNWKRFCSHTSYAMERLSKDGSGRQNMQVLNCYNSWHINGRKIVKFSEVVTPAEGKYEFDYEELEDGTFRLEDGRVFTQEEFDDKYVFCADCEKAIPKGLEIELDGEYYCHSCASDTGEMCLRCGEWVPNSEVYWVDEDDPYCEACIDEVAGCCARCGEYHYNEEMVHMEDADEDWCESCADNHAYRCGDCGDWFAYEDSLRYNEHEDESYCDRCWDDHCHSDSRVGEYHENDMENCCSFFLGNGEKRGETVVLGIEHEIQDVDNMSELIDEIESDNLISGRYVFEHDGSLDDETGVEIISYPASVSEHMKMIPRLREYCRRQGATAHNNGHCGMHIHIDRAYLSRESDVAKLCFIFERHWDNLVKFSRRGNNLYYCGRTSEAYGGDSPAKIAKKDSRGVHPFQRYCAINLQNDNTIEIRLWRGTLNLTTMKATVKFTARLAELAKNTPIAKLYKMTWEEILGDDEDIKTYWATRCPAPETPASEIVDEDYDPHEED